VKKKIKNPCKIKLNAETIKGLNTSDLAHVAGAGYVSLGTWCVR
jgi:hypothetical protein